MILYYIKRLTDLERAIAEADSGPTLAPAPADDSYADRLPQLLSASLRSFNRIPYPERP